MMNRVRAEGPLNVPSFWNVAKCLKAEPKGLIFRKEGSVLHASYVRGGTFPIEEEGKITPGGVSLLSKFAKRGRAEALAHKHAMLFLYGRDLFRGSFKVVSSPCKRGYVLVYWEGILLGLGRLKRDILYNVIDFGEFLRRGY